MLTGFCYPKVVETSISFKALVAALRVTYTWSDCDAVELKYFNSNEKRFVPLTCDEHVGMLFSLSAESRFGKIHIDVLQPRNARDKGKGVGNSSASANSERPGTPCRSKPSRASGSASHNMSGAASSAASPIAVAADVEQDAEPDEEVPRYDDEDERMYPDLVDTVSQEAMENQYQEQPIARARFDDTDDEERQENVDSLVVDEYDGDDMPAIEWNREDPQLAVGTVFQSMVDCRNAVTTYAIISENTFVTDRSEPKRFTVHCPYDRCRWRLHASQMLRSKLIQIKKNPHEHTCPPGGGDGKTKAKLAKTRWVADAVLDWLRETPTLGPTALKVKLFKKYKIDIPYMRVFYAKEMALDRINGAWNESFQLLYTFKAEVEAASPGSVVEIDKHTVPYKIRGKTFEKECFRRAFVCFKACWQGFLDGCRPYLAIDATALNGRWRGQLVAACAVDGHNWLFPVAFGVVEVECEESWVWFLQQLRNVIGTPPGLAIHTDACKGLESAVDIVFPEAEHRECMRHLVQNFRNKFKGKIYDDNLWPASYTCSERKHEHHLRVLYNHNPLVKEYLDAHHGKLWSRSKFNTICKVDYVTSNLAECFNAKIKIFKGLLLWQLFDKIRQMIMIKMALRKRIVETQYVGHLMLPSLIKALHAKARGLKMKCIRSDTHEAEVTYTDSKNREWRYPVNLAARECSCRQWQLRGKPCIHALHLMTVIGGQDGEVDQYISEYFSVAKFRAAYASNVPALLGKDQWIHVDPGFKLHSPVLTRPPGRPRKNRFRRGEEGRVKRQRKCRKCGILGHIARLCTNAVDPGFGEEERWAATNAEENAELELIAATAEETEEAWYVCISELNFVHFFSS